MFRSRSLALSLSLSVAVTNALLAGHPVAPVSSAGTATPVPGQAAGAAFLVPGDLLERFPAPGDDVVSILGVSAIDGDGVAIALVANTTEEPAGDLAATGAVTGAGGRSVTGSPYPSFPRVAQPGGVALALVVFEGDDLAGLVPDLTLVDRTLTEALPVIDLAVTDAAFVEDELRGTVLNTTGGDVAAANVVYACVGDEGELQVGGTTTGTTDLAPDEVATFALPVPEGVACTGAIVAAIGVVG